MWLSAAAAGLTSRLPVPMHNADSLICFCPALQLADFAERMRAAEAEKAGLEAEIQVRFDSGRSFHTAKQEVANCRMAPAAAAASTTHARPAVSRLQRSQCAASHPQRNPIPSAARCLQSLRDSMAQRKAETDREIRRRERLKREMKELVRRGGLLKQRLNRAILVEGEGWAGRRERLEREMKELVRGWSAAEMGGEQAGLRPGSHHGQSTRLE